MSDSTKSPADNIKSPVASAAKQGIAIDEFSDVIDLRFLFIEILKKWWLILAFACVGAWNGIGDMHSFSPSFQARMVVAPVEDGGVTGPSVGGSAAVVGALTGLKLGSVKKTTKLDRVVHSISTLTLARKLDQKYDLMKKIYGGAWNAEKGEWRRPQGRKFVWREKVNKYLRQPTWSAPTIEDLSAFLNNSFQISEIDETPYKTLTFTHSNPKEALYYLKLIYSEAEEYVRQQDEIERSLRQRYLEERLRSTNIREFKQALVNLLADEARREMMSHGDLPKVAKILDKPYVSKHKTTPGFLRFLGFPIVFAASLAIGLILLFVLIRKE